MMEMVKLASDDGLLNLSSNDGMLNLSFDDGLNLADYWILGYLFEVYDFFFFAFNGFLFSSVAFFLGLFVVVVVVVGGCSGSLGFEIYLGTGFEFLFG